MRFWLAGLLGLLGCAAAWAAAVPDRLLLYGSGIYGEVDPCG